MTILEKVLNRLKRQNEAYENERNNSDDGMIDIALACDLADSVSYLIKTIEEQQKALAKIKFLKHCFHGDRKSLHEEIDKIIAELD